MPVTLPNFIVLSQMMYKKRVITIFLPTCEFLCPGEPFGQSSPILGLMCSKAKSVNVQILSRSDNLCTRYLLPNLIDFVDSVINKHTTKQ